MTDKEVIIDGVNVAVCGLYEHNPKYRMFGDCDCQRIMVDQSGHDELSGAECKGYDCYYKQLQRKTQECKELKEWKNEAVRLWNRTCRCEYLDEENVICKETHKECIGIVNCRDRYKQALEKIKELVTITSQMEHSCATETIFEIINEVSNEY